MCVDDRGSSFPHCCPVCALRLWAGWVQRALLCIGTPSLYLMMSGGSSLAVTTHNVCGFCHVFTGYTVPPFHESSQKFSYRSPCSMLESREGSPTWSSLLPSPVRHILGLLLTTFSWCLENGAFQKEPHSFTRCKAPLLTIREMQAHC